MSESTKERSVAGTVLTVIHCLLIAGYVFLFGAFLVDYIPNPQAIGLVAFLLIFLVYGAIAPAIFGIVEIIRAATHRIKRKAEWITYLVLLLLYVGIVATFFILSQNGSASAA